MRIKSLLILLFAFLYFSCLSTQNKTETAQSEIKHSHILILKDGREYRGALKEIDENKVIFEINGQDKEWNKIEIERIQFQRKRQYEQVKNIEEIKDKEIKDAWQDSKKWNGSRDEQIVILLDRTDIEFNSKNKVTYRLKKIIKVLNEEGKNFSTQYFYYFKDKAKADLLYGITILPDGSITSVDESAINDEPINNKYPHYNRLQRIKFGLGNVDIGSILAWEAVIESEWDQFDLPFLFEKDLIIYENVVKRIINIRSSDHDNINYEIYGGLIKFSEPKINVKKELNKRVYSIIQENVKGYIDDESNSPSDSLIYPKISITNDIKWEKISEKYNKTYFSTAVESVINDLAQKIVKKEAKNDDILKQLYEYVNRKINIANVPLSQYSFLPNDAKTISEVSALNILDKSYLFVRLAKSFNIPVKMYMYRSNYRNDIINKSVSLKHFDSVICQTNIGSENIYISFEDQNYNIGQVDYATSNAWAIELTDSNSSLIQLDELPFDYNKFIHEYNCVLEEDNSLLIERKTTILGSSQANWRSKRFLSQDELDKLMKLRISSLGNDVVLEGYSFVNDLADFDKPIIFKEKIRVNNYSFSSGDDIKLLKIPGMRFSAGSVSKAQRSLPYDFGVTSDNIYKLSLKFPGRFRVKYLPKSMSIKNDDYNFTGSYNRNNNNEINVEFRTSLLKDLIETSKYTDLKDWLEQRAKLTDEWILLEAVN